MTTGSFDGHARKLPQHDRPHNSWHEANRCAQCGKSARWVRCGGGWKRIHGLASEALPEETRPENWRGIYYVYVVEDGIERRVQRRPVLGPIASMSKRSAEDKLAEIIE